MMKKIIWHQVFSNYQVLNFSPNGRKLRLRIKQPLSGQRLALELCNRYDFFDLNVESIKISSNPGNQQSSVITLDNRPQFIVPAGSTLWTDDLDFSVTKGADILIEALFSNEINRVSSSANLLSDHVVHSNIRETNNFIFGITSVALETKVDAKVIAFFGDSLTNQGFFSDSVIDNFNKCGLVATSFNAGISGNRLTHAGSGISRWKDSFGVAGINRFQADVVDQKPDLIVSLIGLNDLFHPGTGSPLSELPTKEELIQHYKVLISLAKKADIPFVPLTLPPFNYSYNQGKPSWTEEKEAIRTAFNQWLMTQENTIDINDMVRDPSDKTRLASAFDSGDHLHFSQTGGEILGKAVAEKILCLSLL